MDQTNLTFDQQQHVESHAPYLKVFGALLVLTILEYCYAKYLNLSFLTLVFGLMCLAIVKASLVGWYFMHLKFEGRWVYLMLVPAGFLMLVVLFALYPDIGMQRTIYPDYRQQEEELSLHSAEPAPVVALLRR